MARTSFHFQSSLIAFFPCIFAYCIFNPLFYSILLIFHQYLRIQLIHFIVESFRTPLCTPRPGVQRPSLFSTASHTEAIQVSGKWRDNNSMTTSGHDMTTRRLSCYYYGVISNTKALYTPGLGVQGGDLEDSMLIRILDTYTEKKTWYLLTIPVESSMHWVNLPM